MQINLLDDEVVVATAQTTVTRDDADSHVLDGPHFRQGRVHILHAQALVHAVQDLQHAKLKAVMRTIAILELIATLLSLSAYGCPPE